MKKISINVSAMDANNKIFSRIAKRIRKKGYVVVQETFDPDALANLYMDVRNMDSRHFHAAGIGRDQEHHFNRFIRSDRIRWVKSDYPPAQFYLEWMEQLRMHLNRKLFLGLFDFECHFAHYPEGAFYKKHLDAFRGVSNRVLSTVLYLNPEWLPEDGGELVIYKENGNKVLKKIMPTIGTLVIFLSEEFPHEVLESKRSRYSLTGWYRINSTTGLHLDPST